MTPDTTAPQRRRGRRGRPRSDESTRRILDAAQALLVERGFAGLTLEEVASRASVGLGTIYRRWDSREHLLRAVVGHVAQQQVAIPDTGSVRDDLGTLNRGLVVAFRETDMGRVLMSAIGEGRRDAVWAGIVAEIHRARRDRTREIISRAVDRGELPPDTDGDLLLDLLGGLLWQRRLIADEPLTEADMDRAVELVLRGAGWTDPG